ncbi:hypothetical protein SLS64_005041 [Diaporthe eres]
MATPNPPNTAAITQHIDFDPTTAQRVSHRAVPQQPPTIQEPDPAWASAFAALESRIRRALGDTALHVGHVGSTSVPGLPAKPVIDVDIVVADPADEAAYVAALVGEGWEGQRAPGGTGLGTGMGPEGGDRGAGLQFILREPAWHQHRFFHPDDRDKYAAVKREAAAASREAGETVQDYNLRKEFVIREILDRAFKAEGLLQ